ncbi:hypothetical protein [Oryzifoliimicrobium ureilyticus]|uniref:hypothetical protein n=1 Tax=Oryzifoliimicrobium ureilyticus TaxID=3113724 RepID=UPI0030761BB3
MKPFGILIMAGLAFLAGCQRPAEKMVEVSGHLFVFNYRVATATYLVTLRKTGPIPDGADVAADFENPMGGAPVTFQDRIFPGNDKIVLQSPPMHCIRKDRPYTVKIRLLMQTGEVLQELSTKVVSDVDQQKVLPAKPLIAGPLYDRNPDVFKADGTTDYGKDICPAS